MKTKILKVKITFLEPVLCRKAKARLGVVWAARHRKGVEQIRAALLCIAKA